MTISLFVYGVYGSAPASEGLASQECDGFTPASEGAPPRHVCPGIVANMEVPTAEDTTARALTAPSLATTGGKGEEKKHNRQRHAGQKAGLCGGKRTMGMA